MPNGLGFTGVAPNQDIHGSQARKMLIRATSRANPCWTAPTVPGRQREWSPCIGDKRGCWLSPRTRYAALRSSGMTGMWVLAERTMLAG